ncbi:MAG: bifunctional diaminohydroxyphosphoribosylaminopyrimidine deaminase/5-amino-6-(5-phosphoribosylamino)uracil reductase RibD [Verrucomicrobiota bacterium]
MPVTGNLREDIKFLKAALAEAAKGRGRTHPNPAVGAIVVKNGRILSRGWHRAPGEPHAEVDAFRGLKKASDSRGATLYVTLEPCSTHGRTPPCTQAIIAAGIRRVVYGAPDPNPLHAGRADRILKKAGVSVTHGVLERECALLNESWNKWIATGLPFVVAKAGMSLDGCIASPPGRRWITSEESRLDAMKLRAECGAILVGGATVRVDNPRLTIRGVPSDSQPWRVVWTRSGRLPGKSHLFTDKFREKTLVFKNVPLREVLKELGGRGVARVLIEGGGKTLGEAFDQRLVDRVVFYVAPVLIGGGVPAVAGIGARPNGEGIRLGEVTYGRLGKDLKIEGRVLSKQP